MRFATIRDLKVHHAVDIEPRPAICSFRKGKVYSRSINIGANSIAEFGAESKLRFPEAERIKIAEGFVSLGGP